MRRIDLHAHTEHSDGTLSPRELVERARDVGLSALAVTDHDTTSALAEARATGEELGVEILDGCEITAQSPSGIVHVLAYGFDEQDDGFQALLARVRDGRDARNDKILEKLTTLGVPLALEEVQALAVGQIVARPHFAQAMVKRGYVDHLREAFDHYLRDGGPAYVQAEVPETEEAIAMTADAGGAAVIAHPRSLKLGSREAYERVFRGYKEAGLAGIEVNHPSQDVNLRRRFSDLASLLDLIPTGGSDFHGANKPHIELGKGDGTIEVGYEIWERLRDARKR